MVKEISSQPKLWMETFESISHKKEQIAAFVNKVVKIDNVQVILTGAGSSAFIGEILQYAFHNNTGTSVKAISTTDLVTHPVNFFQRSTYL
jgi:tagatose-6-phosphate ketose/aldose isomerase